jgi:putative spermidine/putrescine transport system substrate-binding protein
MTSEISRRDFHKVVGLGAASIALAEAGWPRRARAEENFTLASTGGSWGEGLQEAFITTPKFEEMYNAKVSWEHAIDSVFTAKAMASCGNPPFSTLAVLNAEAVFLALGGCIQGYDLDICKHYGEIIDSAKEAPRGGISDWFAGYVLIIMGFVYNTKEATKPTSFHELMDKKYKGRVGIPAYSWVGNSWLQAVNKTLGGNEDNIDPAIQFLSDLVKKQDAIIIENTDAALKAFTREEIVVMPFWNGRCFSLQAAGVPVDIEYVPGTMVVVNGFPILKGGKFTELANRYADITMQGQYQMLMTKRFRYPPSNKLVKLPPDMEHFQLPPDKEKNVVPIDYDKMNKHKSEYLDRWNKEVLGA